MTMIVIIKACAKMIMQVLGFVNFPIYCQWNPVDDAELQLLFCFYEIKPKHDKKPQSVLKYAGNHRQPDKIDWKNIYFCFRMTFLILSEARFDVIYMGTRGGDKSSSSVRRGDKRSSSSVKGGHEIIIISESDHKLPSLEKLSHSFFVNYLKFRAVHQKRHCFRSNMKKLNEKCLKRSFLSISLLFLCFLFQFSTFKLTFLL